MNTTTALNAALERRTKTLNSMANLVANGQTNSEAYRQLEAAAADEDDRIADLRTLESMLSKSKAGTPTPVPVAAPVAAPTPTSVVIVSNAPQTAEQRARVNRAWAEFTRTGVVTQSQREQRDILVSSTGAAVVPQGFDTEYTKAVGYFGPIANLAKKHVANDPNGANVKFPVSDDSATTSYMQLVTEASTTSTLETDPSLSAPTITELDSLVTQVIYSIQTEQDAFDLDSFLTGVAGGRTARSLELAILQGKDNFGNALPHFPAGGLIESAPVGATAATANVIGYQDFVNLRSSVSREFAVTGSWMVSNTTYNYLLSLTTSDGRPLFSFDAQSGLLMVLGRPLYVASDVAMSAYNSAAGSKAVLFGDFSKAFAYAANPLEIKILNERYIDTMQKAMLVYQRVAGVQLLPNAVKALAVA